jgi:hypothetical protein
VEPESHRLDREAMLADRLAAAERVHRETDETIAAAAAKRKAFFDQFVDHMRAETRAQLERERLWSGMEEAFASRLAANQEPAASTGPGRTDHR